MSTKVTSKKSSKKLLDLKNQIIESISDIKGEDIISLDLRKIPDSITDFFIICSADATTQVKAIADNIIEDTHSKLGEKPWKKAGFQNSEWILIDYVDIVVHVFLKDRREFYQLEELWSDAILEKYNSSN